MGKKGIYWLQGWGTVKEIKCCSCGAGEKDKVLLVTLKPAQDLYLCAKCIEHFFQIAKKEKKVKKQKNAEKLRCCGCSQVEDKRAHLVLNSTKQLFLCRECIKICHQIVKEARKPLKCRFCKKTKKDLALIPLSPSLTIPICNECIKDVLLMMEHLTNEAIFAGVVAAILNFPKDEQNKSDRDFFVNHLASLIILFNQREMAKDQASVIAGGNNSFKRIFSFIDSETILNYCSSFKKNAKYKKKLLQEITAFKKSITPFEEKRLRERFNL